ncbi:MAG: hypothetical protein EA406_11025 [Rhodospirillales bacterium]|nr:MAG: hypothetical protein EA406_11025 [Rhodospirillales bacterium]
METVHATCVAIDGRGVLLRGPSGAGKSDLALRLISGGAELVADDYIDVDCRVGNRLFGSAPPGIRGLLEVRGVGVVRVASRPVVEIAVVADLVPPADVDRMPAAGFVTIAGIRLPRYRIAPFEASAPAKIHLAVRLAIGAAEMAT